MVIESDSITKEYAKEFLCITEMSRKLVKNPTRHIRNMFVIWPVFLIFAVCWSVFSLIVLLRTGSLFLGVSFGALIIATLFTFKFYISYLKALKTVLSMDRHITYTFSEEGIEYDDHKMKKLTAKWSSFQCMRILKHGIFFIPNDLSGMLLGLSIDELEKVKNFFQENNISMKGCV